MADSIMCRDIRVKYEFESASGARVVNATICDFYTLPAVVRGVKDAGYKVVCVDERYREEGTRMPIDDGWSRIQK